MGVNFINFAILLRGRAPWRGGGGGRQVAGGGPYCYALNSFAIQQIERGTDRRFFGCTMVTHDRILCY